MEATERQYFELLKTKIVEVMQQTSAGISMNIEDWKGKDILDFQEDLRFKANEYISEKWFYNHFKTVNERLPRIDLLNILSRYAGYTDWSEFKYRNRDKIIPVVYQKESNRIFYLLPVISIIIFILVWAVIKLGSIATYRFCFVDKDTRDPIKNTRIEVEILYENESPVQRVCDSAGCLAVKTGEPGIKFLVKAPYYFPDTVTRILNKADRNEEVQLKINDYALMIYYFSASKVDDWKKRREQLDRIIADSAYICQVFHTGITGMELYNKTEFIDLLTIPSRGLNHIDIIDVLYNNEKITSIRFRQDFTK